MLFPLINTISIGFINIGDASGDTAKLTNFNGTEVMSYRGLAVGDEELAEIKSSIGREIVLQ